MARANGLPTCADGGPTRSRGTPRRGTCAARRAPAGMSPAGARLGVVRRVCEKSATPTGSADVSSALASGGMSAGRAATRRPCGDGWPPPLDAGADETSALPEPTGAGETPAVPGLFTDSGVVRRRPAHGRRGGGAPAPAASRARRRRRRRPASGPHRRFQRRLRGLGRAWLPGRAGRCGGAALPRMDLLQPDPSRGDREKSA